MADETQVETPEVAPEDLVDEGYATVYPRQRRGRTQTEWDAQRAARKAKAAETVKENLKKAKAAKKRALAKDAGSPTEALAKRAKKYEDRANTRAKDKAKAPEA
jgi:hypothetical protein